MTTTTTNTTTTAIAKIKDLAEQSLHAWQMAIDTCIDLNGRELPKKRARAEKDAATAEQAWEDAIDSLEKGEWADAETSLQGARHLASQWGDSSYEDEALGHVARVSARPPVSWTYSIYDGEGGSAWPSCADEDLDVDEPEDYDAVEQAVREVLEVEAAGLSVSDGYAVGQQITARAWPSDESGMIVVHHTLTAEDLGVDEDESADDQRTVIE